MAIELGDHIQKEDAVFLKHCKKDPGLKVSWCRETREAIGGRVTDSHECLGPVVITPESNEVKVLNSLCVRFSFPSYFYFPFCCNTFVHLSFFNYPSLPCFVIASSSRVDAFAKSLVIMRLSPSCSNGFLVLEI